MDGLLQRIHDLFHLLVVVFLGEQTLGEKLFRLLEPGDFRHSGLGLDQVALTLDKGLQRVQRFLILLL
jgi:hypothetical protein